MKKVLNSIAQWLVYMAYQPMAVAAAILGASAIIVALIYSASVPRYELRKSGEYSFLVFDNRTGTQHYRVGSIRRIDGEYVPSKRNKGEQTSP